MILDFLIWTAATRTVHRWLVVGAGVLAFGGMAMGQAAGGLATAATVSFSLDFPESNPAHYSITVDATGRALYECTGKIAEGSEEEPYRAEFEVSAGNRKRIFDWAKQARYFAGKIDSGNSKLAFTGRKRLGYQDGQLSNEAEYNYSNIDAVRELTTLFQNIAGTLDYGRRLAYYHRYQKLALDDELKQMETQARSNELSELQGVAPVLREIFEDSSVMNVVRARAQELIQMGSAAAGR